MLTVPASFVLPSFHTLIKMFHKTRTRADAFCTLPDVSLHFDSFQAIKVLLQLFN